MSKKRWEILTKNSRKDILTLLLENRGLKTKKAQEEFLHPQNPKDIALPDLGLKKETLQKAVKRIKKAISQKEKIIVYGDYDADGICATAILWEALYQLGSDALPYIPERISEGYGLSVKSIQNLKSQFPNLKLIITVDNGIVAYKAVKKANELGVDVIITDHHAKSEKLPPAQIIIHTTKIGGAGLAWFLARELGISDSLELAAMGTISDMIPLLGPNRSLVKYGLEALRQTQNKGLLEMFKEAGLVQEKLGTYEVGYILAPRINAMGRLKHAMDSLRLLCTRSQVKAEELAFELASTNHERQKKVEEVLTHAKSQVAGVSFAGPIIVAHESYHEGVIGLAAAGLVEEFYRPAIVFTKGEIYAKASARSIPGFDIIAAIRQLSEFLVAGGGHPMAAGFTIKTQKLEEFTLKFNEISAPFLTDEVLAKKLKIDLEINFSELNQELFKKLSMFEPTGYGNPAPTFASSRVEVLEARTVGSDHKHLKLYLRQGSKDFPAIAFGLGYLSPKLSADKTVNIAYNLDENIWQGKKSLQLKIKDIKYG